MSSLEPKSSQVLFCPFCREAFEGVTHCPDHDLDLVPFGALPVQPKPLPAEDDSLALFDLRFGRGLLALGAIVNAVGFWGPFASMTKGETTTWSTKLVAATLLPSLWTVPIISGLCIWLLIQRRTRARMQSVRIVIPALAVFSPISLGVAYYKLAAWAHTQSNSLHQVQVSLGWGPIVSTVGVLIMMIAGVRLGVAKDAD